ncbi:uncharacterized protein G2W53_022593 [Senna tora]|uniref:Uncharacterized protein n=1 Tax=Senna tora TaxID=362788 RepID=A0A834WP98_9FABA|nr:uncharacterized protein G2W53_022593 [Senna tora]
MEGSRGALSEESTHRDAVILMF